MDPALLGEGHPMEDVLYLRVTKGGKGNPCINPINGGFDGRIINHHQTNKWGSFATFWEGITIGPMHGE